MDSVVVKRCLPLFLACVAHSETKDTQSPCRGAMHYWRGCSYARLPSFFFLISSVYKFGVVQTILELMDCGTYRDSAHIHALLTSAREQLRSIRSRPCPVLAPGSNASLVFDPFVARKLNSFGPLRTHELPPQERVWDALQCFLDDWDELRLLCDTTSILTWEVGDFVLNRYRIDQDIASDSWIPSGLVNSTSANVSLPAIVNSSRYII